MLQVPLCILLVVILQKNLYGTWLEAAPKGFNSSSKGAESFPHGPGWFVLLPQLFLLLELHLTMLIKIW